MPEKKKQHYVPRFYMKRFANLNGKFYLFNLRKMNNIGLVPFKNQCYEDYFYGKDKVLEEKIAILEEEWNRTFEEVLSKGYSESNIDIIKDFIIFQLGRTKETIESEISLIGELIEDRLVFYLKMNGLLSNDKIMLMKEIAYKKAEDLSKIDKVLSTYEKMRKSIDDLSFLHIHFKTKNNLISSDNPAILLNQYTPNTVGFEMIGLAILIPVTSKDVFLLYDKGVYPKYTNEKYIEIKNEYFLNIINSLSYANASNVIYSISPIKKQLFCKRNLNLREKNINKNTISKLEFENEKIVLINRHGIVNDFNLPFLSISKAFLDIPNYIKEAVPRKYCYVWERKLREKITIIPNILSQMKSKKIDEEYISDYIKYNKMYYELIIKYWNG